MRNLLLVSSLALSIGCATTVPSELSKARVAYQNASKGEAQRVAPAELHRAEMALNEAERAFAEDPEDVKVRDLAYVAERRSQWADAVATVKLAESDKAQAKTQYTKQLTDTVKQSKKDLAAAKEKLAQTEKENKISSETLEALKKLAGVRSEERGLVVTLNSSVYFATAKADLMPQAMSRLNQIGTSLVAIKEHRLVIEGHTDATGDPEANMLLSQQRAETVKNFLVSQGYPASQIEAKGVGSARPVGDNKTRSGRANNRRVEIIIQPQQVPAT
jgi:outer membrane protein OmpA-like peptidoglycan-associated protein